MSQIKFHNVIVNGVRTPYRECGPTKAREAVVFVHGNPGSGEDWTRLMGKSGKFLRTLAPDMPGFGKAEKPEQFQYTVAGYARHLAALLDQAGAEHVHLVLHDFGGPWGLAWAADHPRRVASITLINTGVLSGYRWHFAARIWRLPLVGEAFQQIITASAFRALVNFRARRPLPTDFVERMYREYDDGTRRAVLRLYRASSDLAGMARRIGEALRALRCPTLVIWGARDAFIPAHYADMQRQVFRDAEVHLLRDSGHFPYADDPEAVAARLIPFLRRASEAGAAAAKASAET
ncbi:MAG: alpha/beta hydrolase [Paraburkholderia fungorum]|nr:alpha/beta hydrolase [Paraburkholderia fungorum]